MHPWTVGILVGPETPHDRDAAAHVLESLGRIGHEGRILAADRDLPRALRATPIDACIPLLCGPKDAAPELLAALGIGEIPYVGPRAAETALALDKLRSRRVLAHHNLPVPTTVHLADGARPRRLDLELLGGPCVVNPRRGALGQGVTRPERPAEVAEPVDRALAPDEAPLLERAIEGPEVQVVIWRGRVVGMMFRELEVGGETMICPPPLPRSRRQGLAHLALRAAQVLGLEQGPTRVDIMLCPRNDEQILEVEPLPPMARHDVVPRVFQAHGIEHERLIAGLLAEQRFHAPAPLPPEPPAA